LQFVWQPAELLNQFTLFSPSLVQPPQHFQLHPLTITASLQLLVSFGQCTS